MKIIARMLFSLIVLTIVAMVISVGTFLTIKYFTYFSFSYTEQRIEKQCRDYERAGVLDTGSCDCTRKLFNTWQESYDWIDACEIVKGKG